MPARIQRKSLFLLPPMLLAGITHAAPILTEVTPIFPKLKDTTPSYTFSTTEAGFLSYGGACASSQTWASLGNNTVTFNELPRGTYSDCTITVTSGSGASAPLTVSTFTINWAKVPGANPKLNDTGVVLCGDYAYNNSLNHNNNLDCSATGVTKTTDGTDGDGDPVPAGQDALYGRDSDPATNSNDDGWAGFSFTKLRKDGTPLAIQNGTYSETGTENKGTKWSCVKDNVTGLTWEIKTDDGGLRDKDWTYTYYKPDWQNPSNPYQGFTGDTNTCKAQGGSKRCNTHQYVKDVNKVGLCGHHDWRLPSAPELVSIMKMDGDRLDLSYFPDTLGVGSYWSSTLWYNNGPFTSDPYTSVSNGIGVGVANRLTFVRLVREN